MKHTLHLQAWNRGPFNCLPARPVELEDERILTNDVVLNGEFNPHGVKLWAIGNEFGAVAAVWASCEQDALDVMIDTGLGESFIIPETDMDDECARLGNAGIACNLDHAWMQTVGFEPARDWRLLCRFAEARGAGQKSLYS